MKHLLLCLTSPLIFFSCQQNPANNAQSVSSSFETLNVVQTEKEIACKLSSQELQARKEGALMELRKKILETVETDRGFAFRFAGADETLGELMVFIQSERQCCGFFTFKLGIQDPASPIWLEISGAEGTKSLIQDEMGLVAAGR